MLVYSIVFLLLIFGAFHYDYRKNVFLKKGYYLLAFLVMTAMTALRYRFSEDIVEELKKFDFGRIEQKKSTKQIDLLSTSLSTKTREEISELICKFNQA